MLYNPKDYRTNRKAVLELRKKIFNDTVTTKDATALGLKTSQLSKWVKEGKIRPVVLNGKNRYPIDKLKVLISKTLK